MAIASKCTRCERTYTAVVVTCQICGGACVPASAEEIAAASSSAVEPPALPPAPACPCCEGTRGTNTVALQTRELIEGSSFSRTRKYLVTTVKVPGICGACAKSLQIKRLVADVLCLVPFVVMIVIAAATDSRFFLILFILYLGYMIRWLTYNWADALLYGNALSNQLASYAPSKDSGPTRFPAEFWHGAIRVGILPTSILVLGLLGQFLPKRSNRDAAKSEAPVATAATALPPSTAAPKPAKVDAGNMPTKATTTPAVTARSLIGHSRNLFVPVSSETVAHPERGLPAITLTLVGGQELKAVQIYTHEAEVPTDVPYQVMSGPTLLANFMTVDADYLAIVDRQVGLTRAESIEFAERLKGVRVPPSGIKRRH